MCLNDKFRTHADELNKLFDTLNSLFFENTLSKCVITLQSDKPSILGSFTPWEAWHNGSETSPEINLSAENLDRKPLDQAETLLHEMCHAFAYQHKIQDCSRSGTYHNKRYKEIAEGHGLTVTKSQKGGWNVTALTDKAIELITPHVGNLQSLKRVTPPRIGKSKSNVRKYVCSCCGCSIRATKFVNIMCLDCDTIMYEEQD